MQIRCISEGSRYFLDGFSPSDSVVDISAPPSYVSCMGQGFEDGDDDDDDGGDKKKGIDHGTDYSTWSPAYTYYTWGAPNPALGQ